MGSFRELISKGSIFGVMILPESLDRFTLMGSAPGGFFTFGLFMALVVWIEIKTNNRIKRSIGCEGCPSKGACAGKGECE